VVKDPDEGMRRSVVKDPDVCGIDPYRPDMGMCLFGQMSDSASADLRGCGDLPGGSKTPTKVFVGRRSKTPTFA
jgi:hypothetical protein